MVHNPLKKDDLHNASENELGVFLPENISYAFATLMKMMKEGGLISL